MRAIGLTNRRGSKGGGLAAGKQKEACMKRKRSRETVLCPHGGAEIRTDVSACPVCGSDERTGWSQSTYAEDIGLPDDEEYEEMVAREFGGKTGAHRQTRVSRVYIAVAAIVLALMIAAILRGAIG